MTLPHPTPPPFTVTCPQCGRQRTIQGSSGGALKLVCGACGQVTVIEGEKTGEKGSR